MGKGLREHDRIPYRSVGPVTQEEYLSREERYDKQLREKAGVDPKGMDVAEKVRQLREFREAEYESLTDAAYKRRGWTPEGVPTLDHLKKIGMDLPEVLEVVRRFL